jgi:hypothetical protein
MIDLSNLEVIGSINNKTSKKYKHVSSFDLIEALSEPLNEAGAYINSIIYNPFGKSSKHIIDVRLGAVDIMGDKSIPRLLITNSYKGECALSFKVGLYRLVCSNGLVVGNDLFKERVIHLESNTNKLDSIKESAIVALNYISERMVGDIEGSVQKPLGLIDRYNVIQGLNLSKNVRKKIYDKVANPVRPEDSTNTVWALYNIINEAIRESSRSELRNEERNFDLMDKVLRLSA